MRYQKLAALAALAWPAVATAQLTPTGLVSCEEARADLTDLAIGENGDGVRTFYEGSVVLVRLDYVEPACCSAGIAILSPEGDGESEPQGRACHAAWGYGWIDFDAIESSYDPARGLTLTIPTTMVDVEYGTPNPGPPIRVLINAGQGTITDLGGGVAGNPEIF